MKVTIDIDDELMNKAKQLSNLKTKKAVVDKVLQLYVAVKTQNNSKNQN